MKDNPNPLIRRAADALPSIGLQQGAQIQQRNHLYKLMILLPQLSEFVDQQGKQLPLQVLPNVLERGCHADLIDDPANLFKKSATSRLLQSPLENPKSVHHSIAARLNKLLPPLRRLS